MSDAKVILDYIDTLTVSRSTRSSYRSILTAFLKWCREHRYYTLGTAVRYYEADLLRTGQVGEGTAKSYAYTVRSFVKWLSDSKKADLYNTFGTAASLCALPSPSLKIEDSDIAFICRAAEVRGEAGLRDRALLLLAVTCGLSPFQLSRLMPDDVTFGDEGIWIRLLDEDGSGDVEVEGTQAAREALRDYLVSRGSVRQGLPLVAVTTSVSSRCAMCPDDVRRRLANMLRFLGYEYCDVFHGDLERTIATYFPRLDDAGKRQVACLATRLYYKSFRVSDIEDAL